MTEPDTEGGGTIADHVDGVGTINDVESVSALVDTVIENIEQIHVGNRSNIEHVLIALLARGHILIEDVPGVGKTMLARALSNSIDCSFRRIQFTPDLLPSDITGVNVFNQKTREFEFNAGPIFANVVLGDEINRAPPKTQSALLEAMEERNVTIDGVTHRLPEPFTVLATQNVIEPHRTYDLPVAELDRFMKSIKLGYPNEQEETELLDRVVGYHPIENLEPVVDTEAIRQAQAIVAAVTVEEPVRAYASRLASETRRRAELGASPRGTIVLVRAAQARAAIEGRDYVIPDDIKHEAMSVLPHRIRPNLDDAGRDGADVVETTLERIDVP